MTSWILASIFALIMMALLKWSAYQMLTITCLFAIFLNTIRK